MIPRVVGSRGCTWPKSRAHTEFPLTKPVVMLQHNHIAYN